MISKNKKRAQDVIRRNSPVRKFKKKKNKIKNRRLRSRNLFNLMKHLKAS